MSSAMRLPVELRDRLRAEAERRMIGANVLICKALERALDEWEAQEL